MNQCKTLQTKVIQIYVIIISIQGTVKVKTIWNTSGHFYQGVVREISRNFTYLSIKFLIDVNFYRIISNVSYS